MKRSTLFIPMAVAAMAASMPQIFAQTPENDAVHRRATVESHAAPAGAGNSGGAGASSAGSSFTADRTELFRSMDLNGDGRISSEEFFQYQATHGGTGFGPLSLTPLDKDDQEPAGNADVGQSDGLYNTAPATGKTGSEAGRPAR